MASIHDSEISRSLRSRADNLRTSSRRQWGKMSVDQMLWHVNSALCLGLGQLPAAKQEAPVPPALLRFMALNLPWPKGKAPALPELVAKNAHDLEAERQRFHALIEEFAAKPLDASWIEHPVLGRMSGEQWSRLMAKHADHHFRQFGV